MNFLNCELKPFFDIHTGRAQPNPEVGNEDHVRTLMVSTLSLRPLMTNFVLSFDGCDLTKEGELESFTRSLLDPIIKHNTGSIMGRVGLRGLTPAQVEIVNKVIDDMHKEVLKVLSAHAAAAAQPA